MMGAIQSRLRDGGVGGLLRLFLFLLLPVVLMVSRVGSLNLAGIMRAILRNRRKGRLQGKHAKQDEEQEAFHLVVSLTP